MKQFPRVGDLVVFSFESGKDLLALVLKRDVDGIQIHDTDNRIWHIKDVDFSFGLVRWNVISESRSRRKLRE